MTFTELMGLLALTTPLLCGLVAGKPDGSLGLLMGLIVGSVSSASSFLGVRIVYGWVTRHPKLGSTHPGAFWIGISWLLCVAWVVWISGFSFLAAWLTKLVTSSLRP